MNKQNIILEQIDRKVKQLGKIETITIPPSGWIFAIRQALGMSLRQLGNRMGITSQSVKEMEEREKKGTISLNVLRKFGKSMDMKFIYGFIPKQKSLEKLVEERAVRLAEEIVKRTSVNMELEDQKIGLKLIQKAIREKTLEIKQEMPKYLWD
ncbi:MAG: XRE family transcriptional regulator [Bacteroidetes bacterium RBG_13_43_22]|nr:MAG: XRE family transcriptional regulator [Bacteroidetes bacterium RBG_13_43_22]